MVKLKKQQMSPEKVVQKSFEEIRPPEEIRLPVTIRKGTTVYPISGGRGPAAEDFKAVRLPNQRKIRGFNGYSANEDYCLLLPGGQRRELSRGTWFGVSSRNIR